MDNNNQTNQFGQDVNNQANQFSQDVNNQANQFSQDMNNQANQFSQDMNNQANQFSQDMNNQANQFGQSMNNQANQFGQFGQDPYAQANYAQPAFGQQPYNQPYSQPATAPVKKGGSKKAIIGIIIGLVVVAIAVCAIIFIPKLFNKPKDKVKDAFKNTGMVEKNALMENINKKGGTVILGATVDQISGKSYNNSGFKLVCGFDKATMNESISIYSIGGGNETELANAVTSNDTLYIALPDGLDGYVTLPTKDVADKIKNSPVFSELSSEIPNFDSLFTSASVSSVTSDDVASKALKKITDNAKYEKKGKISVDVNGQSVKATEYDVTYFKSDIQSAFEDIYKNSAAASGIDNAQYDQLKQGIGLVIGSDIVAKVYVKDDKVCKITVDGQGVMQYSLWLDIDENRVSGNFKFGAMGQNIEISLDINDLKTAPNGSIKASVINETLEAKFSTKADKTDSKAMYDVTFEILRASQPIAKFNVLFGLDTTLPTAATIDSSLPTYDILSMTKDEIMNMIQMNSSSLMKWVEKLSDNDLVKSLGSLTNSLDNIDYDELDKQTGDNTPDDTTTTATPIDATVENGPATLNGNSGDVTIDLTKDGYEKDFEGSSFIAYYGDSYNVYVDYRIESATSAKECANGLYAPSSNDYTEITPTEEKTELTFDIEGEEVCGYYLAYHSKYTDFDSENDMAYMKFAKQINDNECLIAEVTVYDMTKGNYTADMFADLLSKKFCTVK